ncbi:hypothetical protein A8L34_29535 [Bacillus sp. FJAT-27264]|uniref:hypothetical protein n=1 Tax=Paenibacillus sp. (strain DSM 101736 / FJAT-27264) TaxID=1850362 RepID=UPI000807EC10|nr:hypothetical protein [Bacillus sp. FJAT-27264]OBZ15203.1 hypothetical protein A8L34_29535 [Bacillus sp. FJAT-27264]
MTFKSMQVYTPIKNVVKDFKKEMELSNESEVIAYLYQFYLNRKKSLSLEEHREIKEGIEKIINQASM